MKRVGALAKAVAISRLHLRGRRTNERPTMTPSLAFLIAALVLFIIETVKSRSLVSAGLACATVAVLLTLI